MAAATERNELGIISLQNSVTTEGVAQGSGIG